MAESALPITVARVNPNDHHVDLVRWCITDGDFIEAGGAVAEIESSKAVVTIESPHKGFVKRHFKEGQSVPVGATLASCFTSKEACMSASTASAAPARPGPGARAGASGSSGAKASLRPAPRPLARPKLTGGHFPGPAILSPAAAEFVRERGVNVAQFANLGLVTLKIAKELLDGSVDAEEAVEVYEEPTSAPIGPADVGEPQAGYRSVVASPSKRREIAALTSGQAGLINSSLTIQFDSKDIRDRLKRANALGGQMSPLIIYHFARLVEKHPDFRAFYHQGHIHYHEHVNVGIAIDFGQGLRVAVIKDTNHKTPADIYAETVAYGAKYLHNELSTEDLSGGSVTVTDLTAQEILYFQPLVNERQSAILGIGGDATAPGFPMALTLAFDHRILSGQAVGDFLKTLRRKVVNAVPEVEAESEAPARFAAVSAMEGSR